MIASTPIAVLPVPRSPMISSRWPRPIGIIESMALSPVWSGSFRPAVHDARGIPLDRPELLGVDRALAVHRLAERVDDAARQGLADRHLGDPVRALDDVAFLDELVVAEEHRADLVLLEVEDHPDDVAGELEQLTRHRLLEPVDAGDAVADLDDAPDLLQVDLRLVACQLSLENLADLSGLDHPCP